MNKRTVPPSQARQRANEMLGVIIRMQKLLETKGLEAYMYTNAQHLADLASHYSIIFAAYANGKDYDNANDPEKSGSQ